MKMAIRSLKELEEEWGLKINLRKSEVLAFDGLLSPQASEVEGVPVVSRVRYLGVTISLNREDMSREARNAVRRNVALMKFKLGKAELAVKEQVLISYARSLLVSFATPLHAARIWTGERIEKIERELYKEVFMLPQDMNRGSKSTWLERGILQGRWSSN